MVFGCWPDNLLSGKEGAAGDSVARTYGNVVVGWTKWSAVIAVIESHTAWVSGD